MMSKPVKVGTALIVGLALAGSANEAFARTRFIPHGGFHGGGYHRGGGIGAGGLAAGAALGVLGGVAAGVAADRYYNGYPSYNYGPGYGGRYGYDYHPGYGYYGPY